VHFPAVFNWQKTRTVTESIGTRILRFNRETKLTKSAKIIQKFTVRLGEGGGGRTIAPPLNTPLVLEQDIVTSSDEFEDGCIPMH